MTDLRDRHVAVSISDAPDRARLGLPQREIDRALFSICTALVRSGSKIVYGGNLAPDGFTFKMFRHLAGAYASASQPPFVHVIPEPIFRTAQYAPMLDALREGQRVVQAFVCLGNDLVSIRSVAKGIRLGRRHESRVFESQSEYDEWLSDRPTLDPAEGYSVARVLMNNLADARVVLGGKMGILSMKEDKYLGKAPGIVEEAILALRADKPCVPLGAFGGAARDVAIALGLMDEACRVPRGEQVETYSGAIDTVADLRNNIPADLRPTLEALAIDDRSEPMAYDIAKVLAEWLNKGDAAVSGSSASHSA